MKSTTFVLFATATIAAAGCAPENDGSTASNIVEIHEHGHNGRFAARGLLGHDAQTQFDTTTGAFDSIAPPPPGSISTLLLTVFNGDGSVQFTRSFDHIDPAGAYSFALNGLPRGTPFQIQASVSGVRPDPFTTVQVHDIVRLRPDIIVGPDHTIRGIVGPDRNIVGPDHLRVDHPVEISAQFRELNGDSSAISDCVLAVDSVEVARYTPLAVAAGGSSTCSFQYAFPALGVHSVSITADNVKPSDYDLTNNSLVFEVTIVGPDRPTVHGPPSR